MVEDARKNYFIETCGDFDWSKRPHWANADSVGAHLGLDAARAVEELRRLYPPDVCRALAESEDGRRLITTFFIGWPPDAMASDLLLGHDLVSCAGWYKKPGLVAHLRLLDQFPAARV